MAREYCVTVVVKPEGCKLLLLLEEDLSPHYLMSMLKESLTKEYRQLNSVASWCFHWGDQTPLPGMFVACRTSALEEWILRQAAKSFNWELVQ